MAKELRYVGRRKTGAINAVNSGVMATNSQTHATGYLLPQQDLPRIFLILITDPKNEYQGWNFEAAQITSKNDNCVAM